MINVKVATIGFASWVKISLQSFEKSSAEKMRL
jgi:hypothetical protein